MSVAVVVVTYNQEHLLRQCVERVLGRTTAAQEILIWDNASTDGTGTYLDSLDDPRFRVVRHPRNIGLNAYADAFALTTAQYKVMLDHDVIDAPDGWDAILLDAFRRLPDVGLLGADIADDEYDLLAHYRHRVRPHLYTRYELNGVALLDGPVGGTCAMTSAEVMERAGGFPRRPGQIYWLHDEAYVGQLRGIGSRVATLAGLRVRHAGGPHYGKATPEKDAYWDRYHAVQARKDAVKRALLRIPLVRGLNARHGWFVPPEAADAG